MCVYGGGRSGAGHLSLIDSGGGHLSLIESPGAGHPSLIDSPGAEHLSLTFVLEVPDDGGVDGRHVQLQHLSLQLNLQVHQTCTRDRRPRGRM